jgi:hypothetical protein
VSPWSRPHSIAPFDPFELPDWTGTEPVTWQADAPLDAGALIPGTLRAGAATQQLDLVAVDAAYPAAVCPESIRVQVHQAWQLGEVVLLDIDGRVVVAAPGTGFDANGVCDVLRRFGKAVGAPDHNLTVSIVL